LIFNSFIPNWHRSEKACLLSKASKIKYSEKTEVGKSAFLAMFEGTKDL
jgi:hypothetical protein